jgi:hypothetical protein
MIYFPFGKILNFPKFSYFRENSLFNHASNKMYSFPINNISRYASKLLITVLLFSTASNIHFLWSSHLEHNECLAYPSLSKNEIIIKPVTVAILYSYAPFIVLSTMNLLVAYKLFKANSVFNLPNIELRERCDQCNQKSTSNYCNSTRRMSVVRQSTTLVLIAISFLFILLTSPLQTLNIFIWSDPRLNNDANIVLLRTSLSLLSKLNHSLNFFIYLAIGKRFRSQFRMVFC